MGFENAFEKMLENEGGLFLHKVENDTGGLTFAGITKKWYPNWRGWDFLEKEEMPPISLVNTFYKEEFWDKLRCDSFCPRVATTIFDFAVNVGKRKAIKIAQETVETLSDGIIGPNTIKAINSFDKFVECYALNKVKYYADICNSNPNQKKFLLGWINRVFS